MSSPAIPPHARADRRRTAADLLPSAHGRGIGRAAVAAIATLALLLLGLGAAASPAGAQDTLTCPAVDGVQCDGFVTDLAGVIQDDLALETLVAEIEAEHGNQVAVVLVDGLPGGSSIRDFAVDIGDGWGVGDAQRNDGIVVIVDLDSRETWVEPGDGLSIDGARIADTATPSFRQADFDGGIRSILGAIDFSLAGGGSASSTGATGTSGTTGSSGSGTGTSVDTAPGGDTSTGSFFPLAIFTAIGVAIFASRTGSGQKNTRASREKKAKARRAEQVDDILARLETSAADLPDLRAYEVAEPSPSGSVGFAQGLDALGQVANRRPDGDPTVLTEVWARDLLDVIDGERLARDTEVPLELRVARDERDVMDDAVQQSAKEALDIDLGKQTEFDAKLSELQTLVSGVRPHRVAEARLRFGQTVTDRLASTPIGTAVVSDRGERLLKAAPVLDDEDNLDAALIKLDQAYKVAVDKVDRLDVLHDRLPDSSARPAVAAALTDLTDDPSDAVEQYEKVRVELRRRGSQLQQDRLDVDAIAALLLMNHDELSVEEFVRLYRTHRNNRLAPAMAVEYSLAGLSTPDEIRRVKGVAEGEGIPVAIVAALLRRRDDGIAVYRMLEKDLIAHDIATESRRTIAGVLAISLEPAQAERRWLDAREALKALGLTGTYADIAAAFGASDSRGPRGFALAYAAQRQALSRSSIDDADRFAPELAHSGTYHQEDTWTHQPLPVGLRGFDPFTFFYLHWVITAGHTGQVGWEPVWQDSSWADDRDSWFGGFGGGGFGSGTGGGGSSWGGGGWSPGSFGGFGGGGFGGGFGGGASW